MSTSSQEPESSPPIFTFFMIVALLAVWGLVWDVLHTADGGSIDFRNRITGVRVASEHRDPYFFKWNRTESERLCDPFTFPASPVNHTTVTPVTLSMFYPLKDLPYNVARWIWFAVEYAALGLGFWAWARGSDRRNWLWGGFLTCLFCLSPHWRLHVDRGQSYVLYAGLFLALVAVSRGLRPVADKAVSKDSVKEGWSWAEGILAGLLALLRPTYAVLLGWGVARKKVGVVVATVVGVAVVGAFAGGAGGGGDLEQLLQGHGSACAAVFVANPVPGGAVFSVGENRKHPGGYVFAFPAHSVFPIRRCIGWFRSNGRRRCCWRCGPVARRCPDFCLSGGGRWGVRGFGGR